MLYGLETRCRPGAGRSKVVATTLTKGKADTDSQVADRMVDEWPEMAEGERGCEHKLEDVIPRAPTR